MRVSEPFETEVDEAERNGADEDTQDDADNHRYDEPFNNNTRPLASIASTIPRRVQTNAKNSHSPFSADPLTISDGYGISLFGAVFTTDRFSGSGR